MAESGNCSKGKRATLDLIEDKPAVTAMGHESRVEQYEDGDATPTEAAPLPTQVNSTNGKVKEDSTERDNEEIKRERIKVKEEDSSSSNDNEEIKRERIKVKEEDG